jgi:hypothetical protein
MAAGVLSPVENLMISTQIALLRDRSRQPGVEGLALIAGTEAVVRGTVLSAFPLLMYRALGDASRVSAFYFAVGIVALASLLLVPLLVRRFRRPLVYRGALALYLIAAVCGLIGGALIPVALLFQSVAAATGFASFNAYVMNHVPKAELSRLESLRLLLGGIGWTIGPALGVLLIGLWPGAPFVVTAAFSILLLWLLKRMNPGQDPVIQRATRRKADPLAIILRFLAQPRLVAGWTFTLVRSCGWWVYIVYVGIFAVENGLPDTIGGLATSMANAGLFLSPLMLRWVRARSVRDAVRAGFLGCGLCFVLASLLAPFPWLAIAALLLGSLPLITLDISGGLPFLMSVKPSERAEMSAVYSSFRDVSGIVSPGVAWLVLTVAPLPAIFGVAGLAMIGAFMVASRLHPRLGEARPTLSTARMDEPA